MQALDNNLAVGSPVWGVCFGARPVECVAGSESLISDTAGEARAHQRQVMPALWSLGKARRFGRSGVKKRGLDDERERQR